ncbi:hypothetical protein DFH09DRAFT_1347903 [Mycena vulgaris]|nr:hypothetical protein DFH09DRAFT_1347903 [Mycena vulgaris]
MPIAPLKIGINYRLVYTPAALYSSLKHSFRCSFASKATTVFLWKWVAPEAAHQDTPPLPHPDVRSGQVLYAVEEVLSVKQAGKRKRDKLRYYIKWRGYLKEEWS